MKQRGFVPLLEMPELRQAVDAVRRYAGAPAEHEEGYDPHVEHREYERLKEEMRKTKAELEKVKARESELTDALAEAKRRAAPRRESAGDISWKRAVVLSEILGPPRGRRK